MTSFIARISLFNSFEFTQTSFEKICEKVNEKRNYKF